ncbi:MAG: triose-phosphate isomerase [Flavobacteriia bacterium]|nr:triose-phosphate isomerase [Flavobacteriia bacterium]
MRKKIVAGNWKMNLLNAEAIKLFTEITTSLATVKNVEVLAFPPSIYISELSLIESKIGLGAQNFYPKDKGAFTGEISTAQIKNIGVTHVLIGHSERRAYFNEDHSFLKEKVNSALDYSLTPVFCCGEPLEIRESNTEFEYVKNQLIESLFHLNETDIQKCVIAYEPVWAIGTGRTATVEQAEAMHAAIRSWLKEYYNETIAASISILYGGSCNASNAKELFSNPNVDGGLIGGAALDATSFLQIIKSF